VTLSRREVSDLLTAHGLAPRRAFGQNFVVDPNTVRRVARLAAVGAGDHVVEIGAGLGSLTLALMETGASVTAIEIDRGLVPVLRDVVPGARVVEGDAMHLDWSVLLDGAPAWVLVANLPYTLATPLVVTLLEEVAPIVRLLVMVQAEVGERWAASVGDAQYGAVSVLVSYWATSRVVGRVPPTVFLPKPKVDSALVAIERRQAPAVDAPYARIKELVRAGFGQRRKMLRRSLAGVIAPEAFAEAGIRPDARAEELDIEAWARLATWPEVVDR
jgi:16S rRNA (adenine1518-N6/adenine1519-N6)-dimethyltransferase